MDIENEWEKYSNGVGRKILAKYGYKGKGLGKFEDGIKEPIKAHKRAIERGGLDYEISASKKQVTEPRRFSTTIDFSKSKDEEDTSTSESDSENHEPELPSPPVQLHLPSIPDATMEQMEILESQTQQIKNLVEEMELKYCTQPINLPESFPVLVLTIGQADSLIKQLSSVLNILQDLSQMTTEELDFEQVLELDSLIHNTIPDLYVKLAIDQYILFIVYPYFKETVSTWNFKDNKPSDENDKEESDMCLAYLQMYRDQFNSWKNFAKKKLSFQNHHLWNTISQLIIDKISNFVEDSSFNIQNSNTTKFLIKLLTMWIKVIPSAINIEHKMAEHITNEVKSIELKDISKLHTWIVPWVHFFGHETMESVLITVYSKLDSVLSQNVDSISVNDFSIIQTLLPWKHTLTTYLYQKLLKTYVVPVLRLYLREFKIDPQNQELSPLWIVFQWYELFTGSHTALDIYIKIFEDEFFERWLNILYTWLSSTKCKYEECVLWYKGWKEFFEENANELYLHIYANFNNAVSLMNTILCEKKDM